MTILPINKPLYLAIVEKWDPEKHGALLTETNDVIKYMKTKYLCIAQTNLNNRDFEEIDELFELYKNPPPDRNLKLVITKNTYTYNERLFTSMNMAYNLNNKLNMFSKKVKQLNNFRICSKNLRHREMFGKYPKN